MIILFISQTLEKCRSDTCSTECRETKRILNSLLIHTHSPAAHFDVIMVTNSGTKVTVTTRLHTTTYDIRTEGQAASGPDNQHASRYVLVRLYCLYRALLPPAPAEHCLRERREVCKVEHGFTGDTTNLTVQLADSFTEKD